MRPANRLMIMGAPWCHNVFGSICLAQMDPNAQKDGVILCPQQLTVDVKMGYTLIHIAHNSVRDETIVRIFRSCLLNHLGLFHLNLNGGWVGRKILRPPPPEFITFSVAFVCVCVCVCVVGPHTGVLIHTKS